MDNKAEFLEIIEKMTEEQRAELISRAKEILRCEEACPVPQE